MNPLLEAARDIRYLLERGYPRQSAIRFVCDHYRINAEQRVVLSRTVFDLETARRRRSKTVNCCALQGARLWIDGFNVLFSVECLFLDEPVFACDDGFLRDVRGATRSYRLTDASSRALDEILSFLSHNKPAWVEFLFDAQVSKSGVLSAMCREQMRDHRIRGTARTSRRVDFELKHAEGIIATSDGIIIDEVERVVNLASCIFKRRSKTAKTLEGVA